jgi:hypothetical protein
MLGPSFVLLCAAGAVVFGALYFSPKSRRKGDEHLSTVSVVCHECFETYQGVPAWEAEGFVCATCRGQGRKTP